MSIEAGTEHGGPREVALKTLSGSFSATGHDLTIWRSYSFAPDWYRDCLIEAREGRGHNSRRREIVFAVCVAECYLLEWVRDSVLNRDFPRLDIYFPPGRQRRVLDKWRDIPKRLAADGLIRASPDLRTARWRNFRTLVNYRNGLVHARSSRPETTGVNQSRMPVPSKSALDSVDPGWPTRVVRELICQLHEAVATSIPEWLEEP
jgi:hypothetical protein